MTSNLSNLDRVLRVGLGLILIAMALFYPNAAYSYLGWLGVIPLVTGLVGWCGLYKILGISTAPKSSQ